MQEGQPNSFFEFQNYGLTAAAKALQEEELKTSKLMLTEDMRSYWEPYYDLAKKILSGEETHECLFIAGGKRREGAGWEDIDDAVEIGTLSAHLDGDYDVSFVARELQQVVVFPKPSE